MEYQDKTITCKDCGKDFVFTANDQRFYAEKGFHNEPQRCKDCREIAKRERDKKSGSSRNSGFSRPGFGSKPGFGGRPGFGGKPGSKPNGGSRGGNFHRTGQRGA